MKFIIFLAIIFNSINLLAYESAFVSFDKGYVKSNTVEIANMPPVRSQDGLGLCTSFAVSAIFDFYTCQTKKINCSQISTDQKSSVLGISNYAEDTSIMDNPEELSNYKRIKIGGFSADTCLNIINNIHSIPKESCAPFDLVMNVNSTSDEQQKKAVETLEKKHNQVISREVDCIDCVVADIKKMFPFAGSSSQVKLALGEAEYEKFLFKLLLPEKCVLEDKNKILAPNKELDYFPKEDTVLNVPESLKVVKSILGKGAPVIVEGLCMDKVAPKTKNDCKLAHTAVISGYSRMCDKKNNCYDAFKVHNSWGQKWQEENNDGWVLADELIKRTNNMIGSFAWLKY